MPRRSAEAQDDSALNQSGRDYSGQEAKKVMTVERLASVVRAGRYDTFFIGWTPDSKPTVTTDIKDLSSSARQVYELYRRGVAGYRIPSIKYNELLPAQFNFLNQLSDTPDEGEDIFSLSLTYPDGQHKDLKIGEQELLEALVAANNPLLDTSSGIASLNRQIATPESLYTLIVGGYDYSVSETTGYAILFKAVMEGVPQAATFRAFVEEVIGNLIVNDQQQEEPRGRKGYVKVASRYIAKKDGNKPPANPIAGFFFRTDKDAKEAEKAFKNWFFEPEKETEKKEIELDFNELQNLSTSQIFQFVAELQMAAKMYFKYRR